MKIKRSIIAFVLCLCTIFSCVSMLTPSASAANVTLTVKNMISVSPSVAKCVEQNKRLPANGSTVAGISMTNQQYLYLGAKAVVALSQNKSTNTKYTVKSLGAAPSPKETLSGTFDMYKVEYVQVCKNLISFVDSNGRVPNYCSTSAGNVRYENLVYVVAKTLRFYSENGRLPNYVTVKKWSAITGSGSTGSSTFEKEKAAAKQNYGTYLKTTKNCQVTNATIITLAKTAIGNPSSLRDAANKLEKYLNARTSYLSYYNTRRGAVKTWNDRAGNCCDLAHLVIACARSVGIPARYRHATCKFTSGLVTGHVYAELWTGSKWEIVDLVSNNNYLGYKNNTNLTTPKTYAELPF